MISRVWRSWTTLENAAAYETLLRKEVFVSIKSQRIPGYRGIHLFRRTQAEEVEFMIVMWFDDMEAVRAFAGEDYEKAVVPAKAQALICRYEPHSQHYEFQVDDPF